MTLNPIDLLDVLGNENRRRILQLLSFRPFYFNEITKRLDVGPKAVIDHLEMLERAGLIECYHEQGRRKYFRIARKTVLEVAVTPHSYGVRAYRSEGVPQGVPCDSKDLKDLQSEISQVEEKRKSLRSQMEEIEAKEMELKRKAAFCHTDLCRGCPGDGGFDGPPLGRDQLGHPGREARGSPGRDK